jgi:methylmalonyl-CoA mutase
MAKAIEPGIPKLRIEEAAARTQARIDSGCRRCSASTSIASSEEEDVEVSRSTTLGPRAAGGSPRAAPPNRDRAEVRSKLDTDPGAEQGEGNLLALAVDAARAKATVGEISRGPREGLWPSPGARFVRSKGCTAARWTTAIRTRQRDPVRVRKAVEAFAEHEGRRPRILDRQDGPGRSRPRPEGRRHGVRRLRLRRRHRPALPDARGERTPGGRERRARRRRQLAGRGPPDAGPAAA